MKTNLQKNSIGKVSLCKNLLLILLVVSAACCKKYTGAVPDRKEEHKFTSKAEAKTYVNEKLDGYAKVFASLAKSALVRKVVNESVAKKFDGDYNVLIKDLYPAILAELKKNTPKTLATTSNFGNNKIMSSSPSPTGPMDPTYPPSPVDLAALEEMLQEPLVVNADTLYPQIYIPFSEPVEEEEDDPCLIAPLTGPIASYPYPVVVPYDGDETTGQEIFDGYTYDANGLEVPCGGVSECFAKMHTVWAVTFNENVNQSGSLPNTTSGSPTTPGTSLLGADAYMPTMTVKIHKESWIKGASEIFMKYAFSWVDKINPVTGLTSVTNFTEVYTNPGAHGGYST